MNRVRTLDSLVEWLSEAGFPEVILESQESLLIVKLPPSARVRLLRDPHLRQKLISFAKEIGFSRIALELSL